MRRHRRIGPLEYLWLVVAAAGAAGGVFAGVLTLNLNPGDTVTAGAREWGYADICAGAACAVAAVAFLITRRRALLVAGTLVLIIPVLHVTLP